MAKQLREIVPKKEVDEGFLRALGMGAAAAGAGALVGASSLGGAPIGAIPGAVIAGGAYALSKHGLRADLAKKPGDWNYGDVVMNKAKEEQGFRQKRYSKPLQQPAMAEEKRRPFKAEFWGTRENASDTKKRTPGQ